MASSVPANKFWRRGSRGWKKEKTAQTWPTSVPRADADDDDDDDEDSVEEGVSPKGSQSAPVSSLSSPLSSQEPAPSTLRQRELGGSSQVPLLYDSPDDSPRSSDPLAKIPGPSLSTADTLLGEGFLLSDISEHTVGALLLVEGETVEEPVTPSRRGGRAVIPAPLLPLTPVAVPDGSSLRPAPVRAPEPFVRDTALFMVTFLIALRDLLWLCQRHPMVPDHWGDFLHYATLTFLMPAYAALTGYAGAPELHTAARRVSGVIQVVVAYVIAQLIHLLLLHYARPLLRSTSAGAQLLDLGMHYVNDEGECSLGCWSWQSFVTPYFHLWYLWYLVFWKVLLIICKACFGRPVLVSLVAAIVLPCFKFQEVFAGQDLLPWQNVLTSFPFFVIGNEAEERGLMLWSHKKSSHIGLLVVLLFCWLPYALFASGWTSDMVALMWAWQRGTATWEDIVGNGAGSQVFEALLRAAATFVQLLSVWGVLHMMPRKEKKIITKAGRHSMANYVFHVLGAVPVSFMVNHGPLSWIASTWPAQFATCLLAGVTSLIWTSKGAWKVLGKIVDPPIYSYVGPLLGHQTLQLPRERADSIQEVVELVSSRSPGPRYPRASLDTPELSEHMSV